MNQMTRANAKLVAEAVRKALQGVADQYGLTYSPAGVRYDDASVRGSFSFAAKADSGVPADFTKHCARYGLTPEDFGAEFTSGGRTFTITGIKPSRHKYPISGRGTQGGNYKFTAQQVVSGLKRNSNAPSDGLKIGDRVAFEGLFEGNQEGTIKGFLGNNRAEVLTTRGETRTPERSKLVLSKRTRTEDEILDDIDYIYNSLSPENLTCDGELNGTEVMRRSRSYHAALRVLFKELGREVSESECYDRYQQKTGS